MLSATADYIAQEALKIGGSPAVRATFLPFLWPVGVDATGAFDHCLFLAAGEIQADYEGFVGGWISEVIAVPLQVNSSPAVFTYNWNYPGYDGQLYCRLAVTAAQLAAAPWVPVNSGDIIQISLFYQFKLDLVGYRAWTAADDGSVDDFTAYAEDDPGSLDDYQGYAAEDHIIGDPFCYINNLQLLGEFTVVRDIEKAGTVTQEAPKAFDDLVAGSHSGLLLSNRQGSGLVTVLGPGEIDYTWTPAPLFSPDKLSFLFANDQNWYGKLLRIDLGWSLGGFLAAPFLESTGEFEEAWTDFITLFLGKITKWGPVVRAVDQAGKYQPNTCEIYAQDFIADCLQKRIALPADDGTPQPLTFGEFICPAQAVAGWSPAPVIRSVKFEQDNFGELDRVVAEGGGAVSLIAPGLIGPRALQAVSDGASQNAYGSLVLPSPGEIFVTGTLKFQAVPATPVNLNLMFLQVINANGETDFSVGVDANGMLNASVGSDSTFNINSYVGVPVDFALSVVPWPAPFNSANLGHARLWINGSEVITYDGEWSVNPLEIRFGAMTGSAAEVWSLAFDNIQLQRQYYYNAYQVTGAPFQDISQVFIDNALQPDNQIVTVGADTYDQTVTRFPAWGMVQFNAPDPSLEFDPNFKPSGTVMLRVIQQAGGLHALDILRALFAEAGLSEYLDDDALDAAYVVCPNDIINARFDGSSNSNTTSPGVFQGLTDISSIGVPVATCLKAITSRMLYWIFIDAGKIKIVPYTGLPPASPNIAFDKTNLSEVDQIIDMENLNNFVSAVYGWYSRNPSLYYLAKDATAVAQDNLNKLALTAGLPLPFPTVVWTGQALDYTWDGSGSGSSAGAQVACENRDLVKSKIDLLLKFLGAQQRLEPVKSTLAAARLEIMDTISIADPLLNDSPKNYLASRKIINLDVPRGVELQALRFLRE